MRYFHSATQTLNMKCYFLLLVIKICNGFLIPKYTQTRTFHSQKINSIQPISIHLYKDITRKTRITHLYSNVDVNTAENIENDDSTMTPSLSELFPSLHKPLETLGYVTPTPIQNESAIRALNLDNLLLIAPTGSGKTFAYILPALTKAMNENGTILIIAPTRELAVQLMRDTTSIVSNLEDDDIDTTTTMHPSILLAVRGVNIPTKEDIQRATVLIGTPFELIQVLTKIQGGQDFLAGNVLSTVILDEVDVLLPSSNVKTLRTSLDNSQTGRKSSLTPQDERRKQEQKRKLKAAQRRGMNVIKNNQGESATVLTDTDKLLRIVASRRFVGGDASTPCQILAGSATASRKTLDRLNRSLREAASEVSSTMNIVWSSDVKACRPPSLSSSTTIKEKVKEDNEDNPSSKEQQQHTIRTVTVPSQVTHQYVAMDKESANSSNMVLAKLAKVVKLYQPKKALIFICGEFKKTIQNEKSIDLTKNISGSTNVSRRNTMYRRKKMAKLKEKQNKNNNARSMVVPLSARKACSILSQYDINANPLHVALGLEGKEEDYKDDDDESSFYVTFEGSARGLHFDNVDIVFIVGRPSSAASYLHLAGRVGRSSVSDASDAENNGTIVIRPGKVISFCTKGSSKELMKWTKQIGGSELEEIDC